MEVYLIRNCEWCEASVYFNEFTGEYEYGCNCTEDEYV